MVLKGDSTFMREITYLQDTEISWKAKGLLTYMNIYSEQTNIEGLLSKSTDGISSVQSGLKELTIKGYYHNYPLRDNEGKFIKFVQKFRMHRRVPYLSAEKDIINAILFPSNRALETDSFFLRRAISIVKERSVDSYKELILEVEDLYKLGYDSVAKVKLYLK
ncbi:MAG: hypothetical protein K0R54_277 [Clostridiaceae bacterium]|nr:hypothetical protein [Clostridiaceae bacterium]